MTRDEALATLTGPGAPFEQVETVVGGISMVTYAAAPPSLRALLERSEAFGERDHLVFEDERYTFAEHLTVVAGLARWLAEERGVGKGDRVAIGMRNYPQWIMAFWATQVLGAVAVPLNAWWTGPELRYALDDSGAGFAVLDGERGGSHGRRPRRARPRVAGGATDRPLRSLAASWERRVLPTRPRGDAARGRDRPRRRLHDHLHLRHHGAPEGGPRHPAQPRHELPQHRAQRRSRPDDRSAGAGAGR